MKDFFCNDLDGNILEVGDKVIVLNIADLEGETPQRGELLKVTKCIDAESNYIEFGEYAFYGHRVLKVVIGKRLTDED